MYGLQEIENWVECPYSLFLHLKRFSAHMSKRCQIGGLENLRGAIDDSIQVPKVQVSLHVGDIMDDDGMRLELHIYM